MPNDDLVLNKARQQKIASAVSTTTTTTTTTPMPVTLKTPKHSKSFSTGHIDRTGLEVVELNLIGK